MILLESIADQFCKDGIINEDQAEQLRETLQLPHIHQYQPIFNKETDFGDRKHFADCCKKNKTQNDQTSDKSEPESDEEKDRRNIIVKFL